MVLATAPAPSVTGVSLSHVVRLSKEAGRQLNDDKMRGQVEGIIASANTVARQNKGWKFEITSVPGGTGWFIDDRNPNTTARTYHVFVSVSVKDSPRKLELLEADFQNIAGAMHTKGETSPGSPWQVTSVDGKEWTFSATDETREALSSEIGYVPIRMPNDWEDNFGHLFGLDPHIARVKRSIYNAISTDFQSRINTVLVGPPGCGKTDICQTLKRIFGEESVLEFDGPSTTMAGAQKELGEREELPRILLVEEIEKAPEASLSWLLSILDMRGEIRKTTARDSANIQRSTKMLAIATVNNWELFQKANSGALASRFANRVFFHRPSRELLEKILLREVEKFGGNPKWVKPTLDFAEKLEITDPREIIATMMCGRDDLLNGSYQRDVLATGDPEWSLTRLGGGGK